MAADFWRFLGLFHGYTPGGASHALSQHRTSAASALAISAVGAGETESNHVYCVVFRLRLCYSCILLCILAAQRYTVLRRRSGGTPLTRPATPTVFVEHDRIIASRSVSRTRDPRTVERPRRPLGVVLDSHSVRMDGIVVHSPPCLSCIRIRLCK